MKATRVSIKSILKVTALYASALATVVACGKFEGKTEIKGTANGVTTPDPSTPATASTPTASTNIQVTGISTAWIGDPLGGLDGSNLYSMRIDVVHGARKFKVDLYPEILPFVQDESEYKVGSAVYLTEGVCGNANCTKFAVMVHVDDISNGVSINHAELWDTTTSATKPQHAFNTVDFKNVTDFYQHMTGEKIQ